MRQERGCQHCPDKAWLWPQGGQVATWRKKVGGLEKGTGQSQCGSPLRRVRAKGSDDERSPRPQHSSHPDSEIHIFTHICVFCISTHSR